MEKPMDNELRREVAENRQRIEAINAEVQVLKAQHVVINGSLDEKHRQNRRDIHAIRDQLQTMSDRFLEKIDAIGKTIHNMQLTSAKAKGYWLGAGAALTFILDLVKPFIENALKHLTQ